MDHLRFGRLVECGTQLAIQLAGVRGFLGGDCREKFPFQRVQFGFNRFVVRLATDAAACLFRCGTCIGHDK